MKWEGTTARHLDRSRAKRGVVERPLYWVLSVVKGTNLPVPKFSPEARPQLLQSPSESRLRPLPDRQPA